MKRLSLIKTAFTAFACLMLAACTSDFLTDGTVQDLPEGKYPLVISSVQIGGEELQTRVSENTDGMGSQWNGGEEITVQLSGSTYAKEGKYTLNSDKTSLTPISGKEIYWPSKSSATIKAWYSNYNTDGNNVNLSDQSDGLAYILKASASSVSYNTTTSLTFYHKLAKVRVELTGTADMQGGRVKVKGHTIGTISNGDVSGSDAGWITMQRISYNDGTVAYEANVIPGTGTELYKSAFQVTPVNGLPTTIDLDASVSIEEGKIYKITLTVNKAGTQTVTLSEQDDVYTVASGASVIIDGGGSALNKRIIINAYSHVMLRNVKLNAPSDGLNTIEVNGPATLTLSGSNYITGSNRCPLSITNGGVLTINGTLNDQLHLIGGESTEAGCLGVALYSDLVINGGYIIADGSKTQGAGIGSYYEGGTCGNITINGGKITAIGGINSAGIGGGRESSCGDITITGGYINATGGNKGAGIGASLAMRCGNITISGKNTWVIANAGSDSSDDIGVGGDPDLGGCGIVTITDATVNAFNGRIHGH